MSAFTVLLTRNLIPKLDTLFGIQSIPTTPGPTFRSYENVLWQTSRTDSFGQWTVVTCKDFQQMATFGKLAGNAIGNDLIRDVNRTFQGLLNMMFLCHGNFEGSKREHASRQCSIFLEWNGSLPWHFTGSLSTGCSDEAVEPTSHRSPAGHSSNPQSPAELGAVTCSAHGSSPDSPCPRSASGNMSFLSAFSARWSSFVPTVPESDDCWLECPLAWARQAWCWSRWEDLPRLHAPVGYRQRPVVADRIQRHGFVSRSAVRWIWHHSWSPKRNLLQGLEVDRCRWAHQAGVVATRRSLAGGSSDDSAPGTLFPTAVRSRSVPLPRPAACSSRSDSSTTEERVSTFPRWRWRHLAACWSSDCKTPWWTIGELLVSGGESGFGPVLLLET